MSKLGDRLRVLYTNQQVSPSQADSWACIAEAFANEVRSDAIPWAHKALDEVGAPKGPDIAGRIRELVNVSSRRSLELHARIEEVERQRDRATVALLARDAAGFLGEVREDAAPARLTENALASCKAFNAPTEPSEAILFLAHSLNDSQVVCEELRAIIVEAIKGAR